MVEIIVVVHELGRLKPDCSLTFDVPSVPSVGDFISIQRPDVQEPFGEDVVVRQVWWRLKHPGARSYLPSNEKELVGSVVEVFVECDPALTPYSSQSWQQMLEAAKSRDAQVPEIAAARFVFAPDSDTKR